MYKTNKKENQGSNRQPSNQGSSGKWP